jgi:hypothetical protein
MPWVMYTSLFVSQIGNSYFRSWNIRSLGNGLKWQARISWFLYGLMHLVSISIGIKAMWEFDMIGIFIWFLSSHIGLELGMIKKRKL